MLEKIRFEAERLLADFARKWLIIRMNNGMLLKT